MLWPLFQNWGLSKLQNEILTKNSTLSHRHELVLLEFEPNLWIPKLNWCQKYPLSEISVEKIIVWGRLLIKISEITPLSLFSGKVRQANDCKVLEYNLKTFHKALPKFATFSQIRTCKQKPSQKYRYVKNWHIGAFGPKLRYFLSPPWKHAPLVLLRIIWSHFCCER